MSEKAVTSRTLLVVLQADVAVRDVLARDVVRPDHAVRMVRAIPGSRLMVVPGDHGNYLGDQAATGGGLRTMRATVPFLLRHLDDA